MTSPANTPKPAATATARRSLQYYARTIHRILGFLAFGLAVVYAVSGITLIHRSNNFLKHQEHVVTRIDPGLNPDQLGEALKIKRMKVTDETAETITFDGGEGVYQKASGEVSYTRREVAAPVSKFITLHKMADGQSHAIALFTTIFGAILLLLALTAPFMSKPGTRQFRANMIYLAAGVVAATLLVVLA